MQKKAILSVCFGTNDKDLERRTLDLLEAQYREAFPGIDLYRAITNEALINLIHESDGEAPVYAVRETLARMVLDGITHVYVQPAYLLHGVEYEELTNMILSHKADFIEVKCGLPLLSTQKDLEQVAAALMSEHEYSLNNEAFCFIGHGSAHHTNAIYCALDYALKDLGFKNSHIATFNAYPTIDTVIKHLKRDGIENVNIAPFMFTAGESAMEGVCGTSPESIPSKLRAAGFTPIPHRTCIGEIEDIRNIYIRHLEEIIK